MFTIEARGITKNFGGLNALLDVDLQIPPSHIIGLIGPNGAGKSTLVNVISGIVPPDRGEVLLNGTRLTQMAPHEIAKRGVARSFQIVRPLRGLTVKENVMVGALFGRRQLKDMRHARKLAEEALKRVQLQHREHADCRDISTGEMKKMDFARVLVMDPQIILLDEPLAGVGVKESRVIVELIKELARQGKGILLIEHALRAVWTIADRIVVLHHGQKVAEDLPSQVAQDRKVIAAYLGDRYAAEIFEGVQAE